MADPLSTAERALKINMDHGIFGTFAEIGAGQEVARWFFHVGGAAGTVAKTMSAYDMAVSDAIYGKSGRYVSSERLRAMLEYEFKLLRERITPERAAKTHLFVLADTVSARNYAGTNECHGWIGLRFQAEPCAQPSEILLHVNMFDPSNQLQQEAVGILGVNLIYAANHDRQNVETLLRSIFADLSIERTEIDVIELSGPAFANVDQRSAGLCLVRHGLANAVVFSGEGKLTQPSDILRKRAIVLERGLFNEFDPKEAARVNKALEALRREAPDLDRDPIALYELTTLPMHGKPIDDDAELLRRIEPFRAAGAPIAVTRFKESFNLTTYLRRYTTQPLRFALGISTLVELFNVTYYQKLDGGLLEAMGKMLADNVRIYVYSMPPDVFRQRLSRLGADVSKIEFDPNASVTIDRLQLPPPLGHLYRYLRDSGWLVSLDVA
jgi:hypothetical protein